MNPYLTCLAALFGAGAMLMFVFAAFPDDDLCWNRSNIPMSAKSQRAFGVFLALIAVGIIFVGRWQAVAPLFGLIVLLFIFYMATLAHDDNIDSGRSRDDWLNKDTALYKGECPLYSDRQWQHV